MPVTSTQINGLIGGQQAMFGNSASYARQISPFSEGQMPTYQNPMMGTGITPSVSPGNDMFNQGMAAAPSILNAGMSYGMPLMAGVGMMMGGRVGGLLDPTTAVASSLGRSFGYQAGAGFGGNLATMGGNMMRGGVGGLARAGMMAGVAALPATFGMAAVQYGAGQMIEGAQFANQTSAWLQNAFRFTNPQSRTGMGFGREGISGINQMFQDMGSKDMMTTAGELRSIAQQTTQMGVMQGVRDAKEFKTRFTEIKKALTEIASTFNTTLSEALPFFQQARSQGFWTPQDITRHAQQIKMVQANTGMSAAQAQAVTGMGAQMVRSIGGTGQQGAQMMATSQGLAGAALFGGTLTSQRLQEAGFGSGAEGAQNFGSMMASMSARFARSRVGRWALAAMMNKEGTGLDAGRLAQLTSGGMSVGQMGSLARQNVSGGRAYSFVQNEEEMRGQLAAAGPEATLGIVRSLAGGRLYSGENKDQLITQRIIQRFMGGNKRQAKMLADMARDMPRLLAIRSAQTETAADMQERSREMMEGNRLESFKRELGHWWEKNIDQPFKKMGGDFSFRVGRAWDSFTDRMLGTRGRSVGLSDLAVGAMGRSAFTGNMAYVQEAMGGPGLLRQLGGDAGAGGFMTGDASRAMQGMGYGTSRLSAADLVNRASTSPFWSKGDQFSSQQIAEAQATARAASGEVDESGARALGFGSTGALIAAKKSAGAQQIQQFLKSSVAVTLRGRKGLEMSADDQRSYVKELTRLIQSGAAGKDAAQLVQGMSERQAEARVSAVQGGVRGQFTGVSVGADVLGGPAAGQSMREFIEESREKAIEDLSTFMRAGFKDSVWTIDDLDKAGSAGGIKGVAVTEKGLDELRKDPRGSRAFSLISRAERAASGSEERSRLLKEAQGLMRDVAMDDKALSPEGRSAAALLQNDKHPLARELQKKAAQVGAVQSAEDRTQMSEAIMRRRNRLNRQLSGSASETLREAAGGEGSRLRKALEAAMATSGASGQVSPEEHVAQMTELAKAAVEDPAKAAQMLSVLESEGAGSSEMATMIQQAAEAGGFAKRYGISEEEEGRVRETGRLSRKGETGLRRAASMMGLGNQLSRADLTALATGKGTEKFDKIFKASGLREEDIVKFKRTLEGTVTTKELQTLGATAAANEAASSYSTRVAKEAGLKPGVLDFKAGEGSPQDSYKQLKIQTELMKEQNRFLAKLADTNSSIVQSSKDPQGGK